MECLRNLGTIEFDFGRENGIVWGMPVSVYAMSFRSVGVGAWRWAHGRPCKLARASARQRVHWVASRGRWRVAAGRPRDYAPRVRRTSSDQPPARPPPQPASPPTSQPTRMHAISFTFQHPSADTRTKWISKARVLLIIYKFMTK